MKECPYCAEEIQDKAIKCKHCGEWLNEEVPVSEEEGFLISSERFADLTEIYFYSVISADNQALVDRFCDEFPDLEEGLDRLVKNYLTSYYPELIFEDSGLAYNYLEATKLSKEDLVQTVQFAREFPDLKGAVEILTRIIFYVAVSCFGSGALREDSSSLPNYLNLDNPERVLEEYNTNFHGLTEIALLMNIKIKEVINFTKSGNPSVISEDDLVGAESHADFSKDAEAEQSDASPEDLFKKIEPRMHHYTFAHKLLCEMVFGRPDFAYTVLSSLGADEFLNAAWKKIDDLIQLDEILPSEGLSISKHKNGNNTAIFLVIMPEALRMGEAHFVAILFQTEQSGLFKKKIRIMDTKYYTLEFHNEQQSMLCQWSKEGDHMNLGDFGTPDQQHFLELVKEKI